MEQIKYTVIRDKAKKLVSKKNNFIIIIILIIGVALMLLSSADTEPIKRTHSDKMLSKESTSEGSMLSEEERLEKILSDIDGAGEVSVMITYYGTGEKSLAYEVSENISNTDRDGNIESEKSMDQKAVMSNGEPLITEERYPRVKGVVVTADGAGDIAVKRALLQAVSAVLDVGEHRVCIYKKRRS